MRGDDLFCPIGRRRLGKNYWSKSVLDFTRTEHPRENITTKNTKDTKGNQVIKNFVIFVYFVVNKFYSVLKELSLPLKGRPPRRPPRPRGDQIKVSFSDDRLFRKDIFQNTEIVPSEDKLDLFFLISVAA